MISGTTATLSLIALVLGTIIGFEVLDPTPPPLRSPLAHSSRVPLLIAQVSKPPIPADISQRVDEVLTRPLFSPDRRPVAVSAQSVAGLSRLTGIVVTGSRKIAIFAGRTGGQPLIAEEGSHVNAFEVTSISETGVTVIGPTGRTVMTPVFDPAPASAPRALVPPVATRPQPPRPARN